MEYNFITDINKTQAELEAVNTLKKWNIDWNRDKEKVWEILQEIFETDNSNEIKKDDMGIFLSTLLYIDDEKFAERSLRNLYYTVKRDNSKESLKLLTDYCSDAFDEDREMVRGRKHWITLSFIHENYFDRNDTNRNINNKIESYVRKLKDSEKSEWVWERIFGVLVNWNVSYRIYPELKSWGLPELGNNFKNFARNAKYYYNNSVEIQQGVLERIGTWVQLAIDKKIDYEELDWLFRTNGEANSSFPLPINIFESMYKRKDEYSRIILLHFLSRFLDSGLWEKVSPYIDIIRKTNPIKNNLYEEMSLLLIKVFAFMEGKTNESPFNNILDFLTSSIDDKFNKSEIYYDISSSSTPLLLRLLTDRTEKNLKTENIEILLKHDSAFYNGIASTLLLHAYRNGYDISGTIDTLKIYLNNNPLTKNPFASGKDIEKDEFNFRYTFGSAKGFIDISKEGEDGFFNLGGLTGLLEACQPPTVSFRVALALREYGEANNNSELINFLTSFKSQNDALKDLEPIKIQEQGPMLSSFIVMNKENKKQTDGPEIKPILELENDIKIEDPKLPAGPMKLPELVDLFNSALTGTQDLETIASNKQEEIKELYKNSNTNKQRSLIKQAFGENSGITNIEEGGTGHFASIVHRMEEGENKKLNLCKKAPDGSIDFLACYLPQNGNDKSISHRYGIYFFAQRCIPLIKKYNLNIPLFIKTIAVHELFHAHMDFMVEYKGKYHSHKGETPSYCRLEEAAANFMAHQWLFSQDASENDKKAIADVILKTIKNGGILGYGEYNLMDAEVAEFLPGMIIDTECHVLPPTYKNEKITLDWGFNIKRQKARQIWSSLLRDMEEEVVPFYFDWERR